MRDDNSPDDTVYKRSLPLQFHRHLKEREVFSAATMTVITSEITHKEFRQFCTVASLKLDLNVTLGKENRGEQLWALIYQRLTQSQDSRMRDLLYRGSEGTLTKQEKAELKYHVDLVDRQMLLRSRALVLLKERGHDIDSYLGVGA